MNSIQIKTDIFFMILMYICNRTTAKHNTSNAVEDKVLWSTELESRVLELMYQ